MTAGTAGTAGTVLRPSWAEIDLQALRHNVTLLRAVSTPAEVCAVVKADGYGHGAAAVARAALEAGAGSVAVALVEEGVSLRDAGIAAPVLVLSELTPDAFAVVVAHRLTPTVSSAAAVAAAGAAAKSAAETLPVQVKVDTGMHRSGALPDEFAGVVEAVLAHPALRLAGAWTHLAVADGGSAEDRDYTAGQLARFDAAVDALPGRPPLLHAANSAGAMAWPASRYDLVRTGISLYGPMPSAAVAAAFERAVPGAALRPVLSLHARVVAVRDLPAGERPSYGRHRALRAPARVATVPLGYADGVPRALFAGGGEVLVGGTRRPLAGMVTMDQLVVDCGRGPEVSIGDEVVLLGRQGAEEITADEWARRVGTISYEVLSRVGPRVPRRYRG